MQVTEEPNATSHSADETVSIVETRFSIVRDAVVNNKVHMDEAIEHFLDSLYISLADYSVESPENEPLDVRVVNTLDRMKPLRDYFLEFTDLAGRNPGSPEIHQEIRSFLGKSLAYKQAPRDVIHFNHLWCDHYRFLLRELFLGVIALLLASRNYDEVNRYLEAEYLFETDRGPQSSSFLGFDSYIKSLDEFRMRRLRKSRHSTAADFQKERADADFLDFDDIMQADFVLCMRGLMHYPGALTRWFPRTLVHAEQYEKMGFDIFYSAQSKKSFAPVRVVLKVRNKADLLERFAKATKECSLPEWKFGSVPIPFEKYLGLAEHATT